MYVAVKGGEAAIANAHRLLADRRRGDRSVPALRLDQIIEQLGLAVDRAMGEGSLYDKELAALAIVGIHLRAWLSPILNSRPLTNLGNVALPVFCAHLVLCALAIAFWKPAAPHAWWEDAGLLAGSLGIMYLVARTTTLLLAQPVAAAGGGGHAINGRMTR